MALRSGAALQERLCRPDHVHVLLQRMKYLDIAVCSEKISIMRCMKPGDWGHHPILALKLVLFKSIGRLLQPSPW